MKLQPWEPDVGTLVDRIEGGSIDLQPDFQRQEVWSTAKKKRLIDTILRGWSIPPVHLVETNGKKLEVLDGQQRLAAIRDFVRNEFAIDGQITPIDPRVQALHGKFYKSLDEETKRSVDHYPLRCFRITDYQPDEPSELFYRLNQPTTLTAGEKRNALYGPAREQLKQLVEEFENKGNDRSSVGFSNARLAYDDIISRLLYFLEAHNFATKGTEARISERFRDRTQFPGDVIKLAQRSIELFSIARAENGAWRFNKASTLSWLLFFARFKEQEPAYGFMAQFASGISPAGRFPIEAAVDLFQDRASLRVTDVSSVVLRDFCLWFAYFHLGASPLPSLIPSDEIAAVSEKLIAQSVVNLETAIVGSIDLDQWGRLL
jgi:hypothetical protein